jgi:hypothetical protein
MKEVFVFFSDQISGSSSKKKRTNIKEEGGRK